MKNRLLNKKNYFFGLFGILFLYLIITIALWEKLPKKIFLPVRVGHEWVGFYAKDPQNVIWLFIIPFLLAIFLQIVSTSELAFRTDLFSLIFFKSLDMFVYLIAILAPLAFLIISFTQNASLLYYFYALAFIVLIANILLISYKWFRETKE